MFIHENSENIRIDGYNGSWYVINSMNLYPFNREFAVSIYLLESEQYGDEWPGLIVTKFGNVICGEVYNGFTDLEAYESF